MKRKTKVLLALILAAVMAVSLLVPTFAASSPAPGSTDQYITWTLSDDGETLTGDKNYYKVNIQDGYYVDIPESYHYHNYIGSSKGDKMTLYTNNDGKNIVVAEHVYYTVDNSYFATKAVKQELQEFFDVAKVKEKASKIIATADGANYYWFGDMIKILDEYSATAAKTTISVVDLLQYDKTLIRAYDSTGCIYTVVGCLYAVDGHMSYYVDFTKLSNDHFDEKGNFSYRTGTVDATPIQSTEITIPLSNALSNQNGDKFVYKAYYENNNKYSPPVKEESSETIADEIDVQIIGIIIFFIILVFVGLILPVVPLVLGLMLPRSKKLLKPRGWYTVAGASAVWMLSAIVLIVLITVLLLAHLI